MSLCVAIVSRGEQDTVLLRQYLASLDNARLRQTFAAALEIEHSETGSARRRSPRKPDLWKGLPSRANFRADPSGAEDQVPAPATYEFPISPCPPSSRFQMAF